MASILKDLKISSYGLVTRAALVSLLVLSLHLFNLPTVISAQSDSVPPVSPTETATLFVNNPNYINTDLTSAPQGTMSLPHIPAVKDLSSTLSLVNATDEPTETASGTSYTPNEIIIVYKDEVRPVGTVSELRTGTIDIGELLKDDSEAIKIVSENLEAVGLTGDFEIYGGIEDLNAKFVRVSEDFDPLEKALALNELDWVDFAQPNYLYEPAAAGMPVPDPDVNDLDAWYIGNTNLDGALDYLESKNLGTRKPLVAILDFGKFSADSQGIPQNVEVKDHIQGKVKVVAGGETHTHGIQVASVLTGKKDNGFSAYGVYQEGAVALISINGPYVSRTSTDVILSGIEYAGSIGAKIVNMSFHIGLALRSFTDCAALKTYSGGALYDSLYSYSNISPALKSMLFVAAAGNNERELNKNIFTSPQSLASNHQVNGKRCINKLPNLILAGGTEVSGQSSLLWTTDVLDQSGTVVLRGSNYSLDAVQVAAPAYNIRVSYGTRRKGSNSGTSFAAPQVAGAAALALRASNHPRTPQDLINLIHHTGRTQEDLKPYIKDGKTLDVERLVRCARVIGLVVSENTINSKCLSLQVIPQGTPTATNTTVRINHAVSGKIKVIATLQGGSESDNMDREIQTGDNDYVTATFTGLKPGTWTITAEHMGELGEVIEINSGRVTVNIPMPQTERNTNGGGTNNSGGSTTETEMEPETSLPPRQLPSFDDYITRFEPRISYEKSITVTENDTSRPLTYNLQRWVAYPQTRVRKYAYDVPVYGFRWGRWLETKYTYRVTTTRTETYTETRHRYERRSVRSCVRYERLPYPPYPRYCARYATNTEWVRVPYTYTGTRTVTDTHTEGPFSSSRYFPNSVRIAPYSKYEWNYKRVQIGSERREFSTRQSNSDYTYRGIVYRTETPNPAGRWVYMSNVAASSVIRTGTNPDRYVTPASYARRTITVRVATDANGRITSCNSTCQRYRSRLDRAPVMAVRGGLRTSWSSLKRDYERARSYDDTVKADRNKVMVYEAWQIVRNLGYGIAPLSSHRSSVSVSRIRDAVSSINGNSRLTTHTARMDQVRSRIRLYGSVRSEPTTQLQGTRNPLPAGESN